MSDPLKKIMVDMETAHCMEVDRLREVLEEMLFAFSMKNIGLEASKRRLEAIKQARLTLKRTEKE